MAKPREQGRGINWVIDLTDSRPSWRNPISGSRKVSKNKFNVRKCDICNKVWDFTLSNDFIDLLYYDDFPKYGLDFLTCLKCDPNKTREVTNSLKKVRVRYHEGNSRKYARIRKTSRRKQTKNNSR